MVTGIVSGQQILTQDVVYALPGRAKVILSDASLEVTSGTTGGTYIVAPAAVTTGGALIVGSFVRSTTGNATIYVANS